MKTFFKPFILGLSPFFLLFFCIAAYVFHINPQWDLNLTALFYKNGDFPANNALWGLIVYRGTHVATALVASFFAAYLFMSFVMKKPSLWGIPRKAIIYMSIVLVLGPGLVVNYVLKDHIGRARPANTQCFGGEQQFAPAFTQTNECDHNCSFVSGHASFGFYWLTLGLLGATVFRKRMGYAFGLFMGLSIGFVRVMQGRHFLSDVVFAGFFVYIVAAVVYWVMYTKGKNSA